MSTSTEIVKALEAPLTSLRERTEAIQVKDQNDYIAVCELVKEGRSYIKDVGFKLDPGIASAREHWDFLRMEKQKYVGPAQGIVAIAERKGEEWKRAEREAAQREQDKINEKARLEAREKHAKAPPPVEVKPSVPVVAGIRARVNWKFRIVDENKIPRTYMIANDVAIGVMVRAMKDKKQAEATCPGIEVYSEDSI